MEIAEELACIVLDWLEHRITNGVAQDRVKDALFRAGELTEAQKECSFMEYASAEHGCIAVCVFEGDVNVDWLNVYKDGTIDRFGPSR